MNNELPNERVLQTLEDIGVSVDRNNLSYVEVIAVLEMAKRALITNKDIDKRLYTLLKH